MDIRGKINEIDAKKKFHLIEEHRRDPDDDPHPHPSVLDVKVSKKNSSLLKLFFGLEVGCGRRCGTTTAGISAYNYYSAEFMDY